MATLITIPTRRITRAVIANGLAEALFASTVSIHTNLDEIAVVSTVQEMIAAHGTRGCAALMAQAYGDCPETAAARMTWARMLVARTYG